MNYEEVTNVSGNSIMYWKAENKYNEVTYTFTLNNGTATAKLKNIPVLHLLIQMKQLTSTLAVPAQLVTLSKLSV